MGNLHEESGIIHHIGEIESFGSKGFQKREIVLMVDPDKEYPETVPFTLTKEKMELADDLEVGQYVTIKFFSGGRYWEKGDRYFGENKAWVIKAEGDSQRPAPEPEKNQEPAQATEPGAVEEPPVEGGFEDPDSELPF